MNPTTRAAIVLTFLATSSVACGAASDESGGAENGRAETTPATTGGAAGEGGALGVGGGAPESTGADVSLSASASSSSTGAGGSDPDGEGAQVSCDDGIDLASGDPRDAARAMGMCADAAEKGWGLVEAKYMTAGGKPLSQFPKASLGHGILSRFGDKVLPREGSRMLALSSGAARNPGEPDYRSPAGFDKNYKGGAPAPYPKESPSCKGVKSGNPHDSIALQVKLKAPPGAKSLSFRSNFFTYEFPDYVCDEYNDFFVTMMTPKPSKLVDANIAFDSKGNTISVNASFLRVCHPQNAGGKSFKCPLGPGQLAGTGFDTQKNGSAATGWLETTAPVETPEGEITLLFAIWDSGDGSLDSTILLDDFRWDKVPAETETKPDPYQPK